MNKNNLFSGLVTGQFSIALQQAEFHDLRQANLILVMAVDHLNMVFDHLVIVLEHMVMIWTTWSWTITRFENKCLILNDE